MSLAGPPAVELRAHRWRNAALFVIGSLVMTAASVALIVAGLRGGGAGIVLAVVGAVGAFFFGGGGVASLPGLFGERVLALDGAGMEIRRNGESLRLAWEEIDDVADIVIGRNHVVGLRLADPAAAARRAPAAATGAGPGARWITGLTGTITRILPVRGRPGESRGLLEANRSRFGYDVGLGWADRDRSAEDLLALIGRYRPVRSG